MMQHTPPTRHAVRDIPVPAVLSSRPLDARGYPIPFTVVIDRNGKPDFKIVDQDRLVQVITRNLCGLSGKPIEKTTHPKGGFWFVGGPKSAFHEHGAYLDPFSRYDAVQYALKVCPFLAIPGMVMNTKLEKLANKLPDGMTLAVNEDAIPDQPAVFTLVQATRYEIIETDSGTGILFKPRFPYRSVEFWRHGQRITLDEARALSSDIPDNLSLWTRKA